MTSVASGIPVQMRVAFLFDEAPKFPADFNNIKSYYVSREMRARGLSVTWLDTNRLESVSSTDGIDFVSLRVPRIRVIAALLASIRITLYSLLNSVQIVYIDEWFYFRDSPFHRLVTIIFLRIFGVKVVVDQRDPYLDFEVARGAVRPGSLRFRLLKIHEKAMIFTSNLLILPSKAYEELLISEGVPEGKVKGFFRGVDLRRFNPSVNGDRIRSRLGLESSFVIGWFGIMYGHRQVTEVLLPLAKGIQSVVPNGRMLLGGKGPLEGALKEAKNEEWGGRFDYMGPVNYLELPEYLSACDVLLCPVNTHSRFSRNSNWLKIIEGLAMGIPVIATKTRASEIDLAEVKGIIWTGENLSDFNESIRRTYVNFRQIRTAARAQADSLANFGIEKTIPSIVDCVLKTASH